jgi:hypothetical protein
MIARGSLPTTRAADEPNKSLTARVAEPSLDHRRDLVA